MMVAFSVLTLGLVVENKAKFYLKKEGEGDTNKFDVFLIEQDDTHRFFIPLIIWCSWNNEPHSMDFLLKTKNSYVNRVKLNRITLISENEEKQFALDEECFISSSEYAFYDSPNYSYGKMAKAKIPYVISESKKLKIIIYYTVFSDDQVPQNLSSEWTGRAKRELKISTGIMRLIQGIGSSGAA